MHALKNRKTAVLIAVVAAILATLFGVDRSLTRLDWEIEAMFYDGVVLESEGYTQPGIALQLDKHTDAALRLATILVNYPELQSSAEKVMESRRRLLASESIGDKSLAFWMMSQDVNNLAQAASDVDLTQRDMEAVLQYSATISGAEAFIRGAAYNRTVSDLWNEQSYITRIISKLLKTREPDTF